MLRQNRNRTAALPRRQEVRWKCKPPTPFLLLLFFLRVRPGERCGKYGHGPDLRVTGPRVRVDALGQVTPDSRGHRNQRRKAVDVVRDPDAGPARQLPRRNSRASWSSSRSFSLSPECYAEAPASNCRHHSYLEGDRTIDA